jgi:hypothetical protein
MATADLSYFNYDHDQLETGLTSSFHEMSEPEFKDNWCRVWYDHILLTIDRRTTALGYIPKAVNRIRWRGDKGERDVFSLA